MEDGGASELVRDCAVGDDESAWMRFVERFDRGIRRTVLRTILGLKRSVRPETIDELTQEVYCRLLENDRRALRRCRARTDNALVAYLRVVAASVVVDHLRHRWTRKRGGRTTFVDLGRFGEWDRAETIADPGASPEEQCLFRELHTRFLDQSMALLEPAHGDRDLRIFELAFRDGWSSREIAEQLDGELRPGSIDSVIHRQRCFLMAHGVSVPHR